MSSKTALRGILALGLFGVAFSGFLSYRELFGGGMESCPAVGPKGTLFGYPACVYGFFFFLAITILASLGLAGQGSANRTDVPLV